MFKESIKMSWSNITHNKLRSFLTMLGIVIGVASVVALITIVQGATGSITSQISALGANNISVQAQGTPLKQGLNEKDLGKLSEVQYVSGVSPTVSGSTSIVYDGTVQTGVSIQGKNNVYFKNEKNILSTGRVINALDVKSKNNVAIIGSDIAKELFFGIDPVGKTIKINGIDYTVIGMLKASSGFSFGSTNSQVLVPYTSAMNTLGIRSITSVSLYMSDSTKSSEIITNVKSILNQAFNYHSDSFNVTNMQDMLDTIGSITGMLSLLLAGIASISLIVGGIGIMNMMLVSVTERTTEIGLRKALGAEPSRIQLQFIIESIFLSLIGGIIGLLLGSFVALLASKLIGFSLGISFSTILLAFGFSAAVGIVFGYAPARKASRLNPIDALRYV
jgi:putative ABC transport system permease protein